MAEHTKKIYESGQITVRFSPETEELVERFYRDLVGYEPSIERPPLSGKDFFDKVIRKAIAGINVDPNAAEQIQSLQTANIQLEAHNRELQSTIDDLKGDIQSLKNNLPEETESMVLINLNPALADLLDQCVNRATIKSKKDFTRQDIFMNLFWEAVSTGRASLPIIFSSSEVQAIIRKHQTTQG